MNCIPRTSIQFSLLLLNLLFLSMNVSDAQPAGFLYDESKVAEYTLPDPLIALDGSRIKTSDEWESVRRPEIMELFERHMYGKRPELPGKVSYQVKSVENSVFGGKAIRKQVSIRLKNVGPGFTLNVLIYLPANAREPVPAFLGYNFGGNQSVQGDSKIFMSNTWMRSGRAEGYTNNRANEKSRGLSAKRWPVEMILDRGYGVVTLYYGDVEPDHKEGWKDGVRAHINKDEDGNTLEVEAWSAISAWAWGLSRVLDYLETDDAVDATKMAVMGHSRLGKTSLWAGASDERFALTISNDSGCGGAALSRRAFGETVERINTNFPHWFNKRFKTYNSNESALPLDQHMLISLMAPRPVYIASAQKDLWADPNGEFLSGKHASPVYELFGLRGIDAKKQPDIHHPVGSYVGYHIRAGGHDVTDYDWIGYMNFADKHLKR
jgi:hypothetical protein